MKYKLSLVALLMVALVCGFSGTAFAAAGDLAVTATVDPATNNVTPGDSVHVVQAFTLTADTGATINTIVLNGSVGGGTDMAAAEITRVAIYNDVNGNGAFESGTDTMVLDELDGADITTFRGGNLTMDIPNVAIGDGVANAKSYLAIISVATTVDDANSIDCSVTVTGPTGVITALAGGNDDAVEVLASHFRWVGVNLQVATAGEVLVDAATIQAVDDYGNVDKDYVGEIQIKAEEYMTGADVTNNLTATAGLAGATDVALGAAGFASFAAGVLNVTTAGGAAGELNSITHATAGPVVLVAVADPANAGGDDLGLQGSVTIANEAVPAGAPVVSPARGIEVYDTNHNGRIDAMTIFFSHPIDINGAVATEFGVGGVVSGYTISGPPVVNFDAGGLGIRNGGAYGVTVRLTEKADVYDTNVKPDLTYSGVNKLRSMTVNTAVAAFGSAQAVEVDKARPVLISAVTKDAGIGAGTATNGILDGIVFTFSEPVRNITAGANVADGSSYVGLAIPILHGMSFNQGAGSSVGSVHTIPLSETAINTGVTPDITYNEDFASARITDSATSATGATAYNAFFASNGSYGVGDATIATTDGAPMVVHSVESLDVTNNGRLDAVRVTFSENATAAAFTGVDFYSSIAAFASGANANGVYTVNAVSGTGTPTLVFGIDPVTVAGVYDTEATPSFRYDPALAGSNISDAVGNELGAYGPGALTHTATKDMAAPVMVQIITGDAYADTAYVGASSFEAAGADGRLDNIKLVFSEKVQTGGGAQNGGTALDNALAQFGVTSLGVGRTLIATTATVGAPTWTDSEANGDSKTEVVLTFQEAPVTTAGMVNGGDTGAAVTTTYTASATSAYNFKDFAAQPNLLYTTLPASTDGAAPVVVNALGNGWANTAAPFTNVITVDSNALLPGSPARAAGQNGKGDGRIDGFVLKFTENVTFSAAAGAPLGRFSTTLVNGGTLTFNNAGAAVAGNGTAVITLTGARTEAGGFDTGTTPAITYAPSSALTVRDAALNNVAAFENKPSYDGAAPVVVGVNGADGQPTKMNFTFSEPVYAHNSEGASISFNAASVASSALFGYENLGAGPGSSGFTAAVVTQPSANVLQATLNANLTVVDIESDLVWVKAASIFDDADAIEAGLTDNVSANSVAGATIKVWIMDDVIAPWITGAETIDYNLNGKIDHIKFTFSENIVDSSLKGFVAANAMSNDVSATWKVSGYSGPAKWNLFDGTENAGKQAAIDAGKPAFAGNDPNDRVLYLELDEELVPANANTGIGSTGFKPTVTWGAGLDAETLADARPNILVTNKNAADVDDALGLEPTNGAVADKVGPAIVGATISGKDVTVLFSENVKKPADAINSEYFLVNGASASIWGVAWTNNSTVVLTMKSDYAFPAAAATTVAINPAAPDLTDLGDSESTQNAAGLAADVVTGQWVAGSPASVAAYAASAATRGVFNVTNNAWITARDISDATPAANEAVTIRWYSANVDSVDVYVSFNSGESYQIIPGSRVAASAGQAVWTAKLGVTNVKIQSAAAAGLNFNYGVTPVFDGNNQGSSIGAPANLTISDLPNDNGGFAVASFTVSADHLTTVNSYQFYRELTETVNDSTTTSTWVLWATVAAGATDSNNKMSVIVPTIMNGDAQWAVRASTTRIVSDASVAAKAADADALPVAEVVYDAAAGLAKAAGDVVSNMAVAFGGSVDNIAPSALSSVTVADNEGANAGIVVSWVAPADHGIVGSYTLSGSTNFIYGVDKYEVYRKAAGSDEYVLVGNSVSGSTSFVDNVTDGPSVYTYLVKALDSAHTVETIVPGKIMASDGANWDGQPGVSLGDLVLFGNNWGMKSDNVNFVVNFDLDMNGEIGLGDLVLLGNSWTGSAKVAKSAEMPSANVAFDMSANFNAENSMNYVTISTEASGINGVGFSLKYDADKYEFVSESVTGLGSVTLPISVNDGILNVASFYGTEQFNGTITLGFKSKAQNAEMSVEMLNAEVAINGEVGLANKAGAVTVKALPTVYALAQNFPNPFNPTTTIEYSIPQAGNVSLVIYNIAGQKVRTLVNDVQAPAFYKVVWDGRNDNGSSVATGMYFYKLVSGNYSKIVKMTLMK